jgi:hypothetical protein
MFGVPKKEKKKRKEMQEPGGFAVMAWLGNAEEANPVRLIQYSTY